MDSEQLEANQIVKLAFGTSSEDESEETQIFRRILRRQVESLLVKSPPKALDLNQLFADLNLTAEVLQIEMYKGDQAFVQELKEITNLLQREVLRETNSDSERFNTIAVFIVLATAVAGGILFSSIPGAIVSAAVVPLILNILESFNRTSRTQRTSK